VFLSDSLHAYFIEHYREYVKLEDSQESQKNLGRTDISKQYCYYMKVKINLNLALSFQIRMYAMDLFNSRIPVVAPF
jgi:hypothetical protein